jgi:ABC-2 type transport system ATP-binding protein
MEEAQRLCDRVAIIDQGQIIALDTPKALIDSLGGGIIHLGVPPEIPGSLVAEVERLPDVQSVAHTDDKLEITVQHAQRALISVIKVFNEADISITSLEILEPNLETVFLHLTGKRLRN